VDEGNPTGGSQFLAELIDKHGGAILSDLSEYHGVDLRELFEDEDALSPRYVLNLVLNLPTTSALYASRRGGQQYRGWDAERYALVAMVNALKANNWILASVNRDPAKSKLKPPEPFPTPDDDKPTPPKPGSFGGMLLAAHRAQRRNKELRNA
jgi:hypothetical protein